MAALGEEVTGIPRGADRAPVWPEGLVGSISHDQSGAIAIVAKRHRMLGVGIDIEPAAPLPEELAGSVLMRGERGGDGLSGRAIFSAKECVYKALYPLTGEVWPFTAIFVRPDPEKDRFEAEVSRAAGPLPAGTILAGTLLIRPDRILTAITIKRL